MTSDEKRLLAVSLMKGRAGRNSYTNGSKRKYFFGYPNDGDDGYSDCSSAVRACIERAAGIDIGSNTDKQIRNLLAGRGVLIDAGSSGRAMPKEELLKPGDCIYFRGNTGHIKSVGHVEMYTGPNECWGHGSGSGPNRHDLAEYCANRAKKAATRYLCAVRWIPDEEQNTPELEDWRTVTAGEWPIYRELPKEPESVGMAAQGAELRVYGEKDGYCAVKSADGVKGYIRAEAFEAAPESAQD